MPTQEQADEAYKTGIALGLIEPPKPPDSEKLAALQKLLNDLEAERLFAAARGSAARHVEIFPFAWIQPYQMSDDYALAVWNQHSGYYELGDGDCYTMQQLDVVWHPKWLKWGDVEKAIAAVPPNDRTERQQPDCADCGRKTL